MVKIVSVRRFGIIGLGWLLVIIGCNNPSNNPPPDPNANCVVGSGACVFNAGFIAQQYSALQAVLDDNTTCLNSYYVDAIAGNDANSGTSTSAAWQTTAKVNANTYIPGDCILFNRGQTWAGTKLYFTGSGSAAHPIMVAAYGTGAKPVISARGSVAGWDSAANWASQSSNVWISTFTLPNNPLRVWLSGQEYIAAPSASAIDMHYRWFFDSATSLLYVYSESNPSSFYNNVEQAFGQDSPVVIAGQDYITIRNIDARGGSGAIAIYGSSHAVIEGCAIGRDSYGGIWVDRKTWAPAIDNSDYGIVRYNEIDSGMRIYDLIRNEITEDGVHIRGHSHHWEVYGNELLDWGHTAIGFLQSDGNFTVTYNKAYSNFISAKDISYGRGFATGGKAAGCQYNEFYGNIVRDTQAPSQIGGDYNLVYNNVIDTVKISPTRTNTTGRGIVLTPAMGQDTAYVSNYNSIHDNIVYNADEAGMEIQDWHHNLSGQDYSIQYNTVKNNLILNCGANSVSLSNYGLPPPLNRVNVGLVVGDDWPLSTFPVTGRNNTITGNVVYMQNAMDVYYYRGAAVCATNFNGLGANYGDTIADNAQLDPLFVNPAAHDFHLQSASACHP